MRTSIIIFVLTLILFIQMFILFKGTYQLHAANYVLNMEMIGLVKNIKNIKSNVIDGSKKRKELSTKYAYLRLFNVDLLKHPKGDTSYFASNDYLFRLDILSRQLQMYDRYRNLEKYFEIIDNEINPEFLEKIYYPMAFLTVGKEKNDSIGIKISNIDKPFFNNHEIEFDEKYIWLTNKLTLKTEKYFLSKINLYEIK